MIEEKYRRYEEVVSDVLDPTGRRTAKLCLTPYIYDHALWKTMARITEAYANLLEFVFQEFPTNEKIQAEAQGMPIKEKLNIYLSQWQSEIDRILGEYDILMDFIRGRGHTANVIDPNRIVIRDDQAFSPDGDRIDLIYRRFTSDELPRFAEKSWDMAIAWDRAKVVVVNPFCTKRVDSKNIMVLFKDEVYEDVFPPALKDDLTTVREIIPWTKKIKDRIVLADGREVDAKPYLLEAKDGLVIKHANAYSSAAVFLGEDAQPDRWEEIVTESLKGDWIVQEKIELPETEIAYWEDGEVRRIDCIYNVNPYIYDGKIGGFLNRASTDKLTAFKPDSVATIMPCFERVE